MAQEQRLPSLHGLAVFEAVGRQLSFRAAAEHLGTTQPAVSQRIAALEKDVGAPLFRRHHRGIELTPEGERLHRAVREGLGLIREAISDIGPMRQNVLTVATDFGFAACWLMPRLGRFRQQFPDVQVHVLAAQEEVDGADGQVDIAIFFGAEPEGGQPVFPEIVVPVCSPALLQPDGVSMEQVVRLPLLHLDSAQVGRWLTWRDLIPPALWSRGPRQHDLSLNNYQLVLQAALMGQGVALGWRPLVDAFVERGELIELTGLETRTDRGYFLVERQVHRTAGPRSVFREWLMRETTGVSGRPENAVAAA
jgi:putative choline sulfate-utilization transcription factor